MTMPADTPAHLTVVGDVTPVRKVAESIERAGLSPSARRVRSLLKGRAAVGNLECAIGCGRGLPACKPDGAPNLWAPTWSAYWLREAGFDAVSLANNHIMDAGEAGLVETIRRLDRAGIRSFGAGANLAEALRPLVLDADGGQIALLAFGNGSPAGRDRPGVAPLNSDSLADALTHVPASADATVVLVHAGLEFLEYPESWIRQFAREALRGGADVVIGTHPHCMRGLERSAHGMIAYGLGDFAMDTAEPALLERHLDRTALTRLGYAATGAARCREALAADVSLRSGGAVECAFRPLLIGPDFLPVEPDASAARAILDRLARLSGALGDADHPQILRTRQIEKAYQSAFGHRRGVRGWLSLPLKLRRRHLRAALNRVHRPRLWRAT